MHHAFPARSADRGVPLRAIAAVVVMLALAGCGMSQDEGHGADEVMLSSRSSNVINGHVTNAFPSVGWLGGCTATLIGRRTVLTAAHCVSANGQAGTFCSDGFCVGGTYYKHPNYNPDGFFNDIAVLRLDSDFQALSGIIPTRIASSAPREGEYFQIYGFGCTNRETRAGTGTKRVGTNFLFDVDPLKIQYDDEDGALACPGDSGGPLFRNLTDCQIGVTSHRQGTLDGKDQVATRVDATAGWVRSVTGDASILSCGQTVCGDGTCHREENNLTCASDCPPVCGNELCEGNEGSTCPTDCGDCGDGYCSSAEASAPLSCVEDCGIPDCGESYCGPVEMQRQGRLLELP
jgi:hypothetical protein